MAESDDEHYEVPLRDQRYFGAGIKRKRVHFVPSSTSLPASSTGYPSGAARSSASERYLAVVFKTSRPTLASNKSASAEVVANDDQHSLDVTTQGQPQTETVADICQLCKMPVAPSQSAQSHASSLVHQICLPHSHPPSALDRRRVGVNILQSYGWDPDARLGLGAEGEGILHPVKAKEKRDTVGLGAGVDDEEEARLKPRKKKKKQRPEEVKKLDAGRIRKMDIEQKKKDKKLREMFYANEDVERYLGGGDGG